MRRLLSTLLVVTALSLTAHPVSGADTRAPSGGFATVNLFFVNRLFPDVTDRTVPAERVPSSGRSLSGGGLSGRVSDTARVYLDDKFVGHAMFGHVDVRPTFSLPPGDYRFRIECDGYQRFEETLTVLQHGSMQWLVVKLESAKQDEKAAP